MNKSFSIPLSMVFSAILLAIFAGCNSQENTTAEGKTQDVDKVHIDSEEQSEVEQSELSEKMLKNISAQNGDNERADDVIEDYMQRDIDNLPIMRGFRVGMNLSEAIKAEQEYSGTEPVRIYPDKVTWRIKFRGWDSLLVVDLPKDDTAVDPQSIELISLHIMFEEAKKKNADLEFVLLRLDLEDKYGDTNWIEKSLKTYKWDPSDINPWYVSLTKRTISGVHAVSIQYYSPEAGQREQEKYEKDTSGL